MQKKKTITILLITFSFLIATIPLQAQAAPSQLVIGGKRPAIAYLPATSQKLAPILISIHGYGGAGARQESYLKLANESSKRGVVYVVVDGTKDSNGSQFWNAASACCDFEKTNVNDVSYLLSLIKEISKKYSVDQKRIYLIGHSNGGFMSYRLACDESSKIAGIVVIAGAMNFDGQGCKPKAPVSVLHIHGSADAVILIDGGVIAGAKYDSAQSAVNFWKKYDSCTGKGRTSKVDLERSLPGAETTVIKYRCPNGSKVENWVIKSGSHTPQFVPNFAILIFDFLMGVIKA